MKIARKKLDEMLYKIDKLARKVGPAADQYCAELVAEYGTGIMETLAKRREEHKQMPLLQDGEETPERVLLGAWFGTQVNDFFNTLVAVQGTSKEGKYLFFGGSFRWPIAHCHKLASTKGSIPLGSW